MGNDDNLSTADYENYYAELMTTKGWQTLQPEPNRNILTTQNFWRHYNFPLRNIIAYLDNFSLLQFCKAVSQNDNLLARLHQDFNLKQKLYQYSRARLYQPTNHMEELRWNRVPVDGFSHLSEWNSLMGLSHMGIHYDHLGFCICDFCYPPQKYRNEFRQLNSNKNKIK